MFHVICIYYKVYYTLISTVSFVSLVLVDACGEGTVLYFIPPSSSDPLPQNLITYQILINIFLSSGLKYACISEIVIVLRRYSTNAVAYTGLGTSSYPTMNPIILAVMYGDSDTKCAISNDPNIPIRLHTL